MRALITPAPLSGSIAAIPSKSHVHRLLIAAALGDRETSFPCPLVSQDMEATARCLAALGADVSIQAGRIAVRPLDRSLTGPVELDPGESGSTYRFLVPLAAALGRKARYSLHGKLPSRPMDDLWDQLERHGVTVSGRGTAHPEVSGQLEPGQFTLPGNVSSQYFTGLLFALPLLGAPSAVQCEGPLESKGYADMTLEVLRAFGVDVPFEKGRFDIAGDRPCVTPDCLLPEGDWSNSAFWLCAGASCGPLTVSGLTLDTAQGDSAVIEMLCRFGASVMLEEEEPLQSFRVSASAMTGVTIDVSATPDLVPALAAAACAAQGTTVFTGTRRLRLKESDRVQSICGAVNALGGTARSDDDSITIEGTGSLAGGRIDACGDHRIAMMGAACAPLCRQPVVIDGAEAVGKSYPSFFEDYARLGGKVQVTES